MSVTRNSAETLALTALAWLVGDEEMLSIFLGSTGAAADELSLRARDPQFLGSVLDFLLMDDAWVVAFCDNAGVSYDQPMQARAALPGGEAVHWT
ncbi:DUF3572 domain-containing protein [Rhodobacteraceae bacterium D3-12]|nr:DUF3572 domain-containing protein [Rhodobacteraceae bacterium D3-12]